MSAENTESCLQRDSVERKGYVRAHRLFNRIWKERDSAELDILGKVLKRDNLNRAYKRVKANKGAPGINGMTVEDALPWLKEHNRKLIQRILHTIPCTKKKNSAKQCRRWSGKRKQSRKIYINKTGTFS